MSKALAARLREKTWPIHQRLDRDLGVTKGQLTPERYGWLLGRFWGFHAAWEPAVARILGPSFDARRRLHLLEADLRFLGLSADGLPTCPDVPEANDLAEALGQLYVMEGSTLGGQFIARHASEQFGWNPGEGTTYFLSHGEKVPPMWQALRAILDARPEAEEDQTVAMANALFHCLHRWLCPAEVR